MSLLDKLFGKGKAAQPKAPDTKAHPATIKVFDAFGRPLEIPREEWRTKVLLGHFKQQWDDPGRLAAAIVQALNDGFEADALEPARRLYDIDTDPRRGAALLGVVLLQLHRPAEAREVLQRALQKHGEDGTVMTNLAKALDALGDRAAADAMLWRAIQADPNQDNGLLWFAARERERDARHGWETALRKAGALPSAWRPQLWLAREALVAGDSAAALVLYREALGRCAMPSPDMLMQISGDLGNHGQLQAILELVGPRFNPAEHGLQVGNNLIKANLDLGRAREARMILEQLHRLQRPDWKEHLGFWEAEIDKAEKKYGPLPEGEKLEIGLIKLDQPVWFREDLELSGLLVKKEADAPSLTFVCGSADKEHRGTAVESQPADPVGRLTRALPLYLAEQVGQQTSATTSALIPWMKRGGFVVAAHEWGLDTLAVLKQGADHVATLHIDARAAPWKARIKVLRCADGALVGSCESAIDPGGAPDGVLELERQVLSVAQSRLGVVRRMPVPGLEAPRDAALPYLLVSMEQALAVACAGMDGVPGEFLVAERSIIDGMIHNCATWPRSARLRLVLLGTLSREFKRRPELALEYRDKVHELQRQYPIGGECGAAIARASGILGVQPGRPAG